MGGTAFGGGGGASACCFAVDGGGKEGADGATLVVAETSGVDGAALGGVTGIAAVAVAGGGGGDADGVMAMLLPGWSCRIL